MNNINNANSRRNRSVLGLAPLQTGNSSLGLTPYSPAHDPSIRAITKREKRIIDTFHEEDLIIDLTAVKAKFGIQKLAEVQEYASNEFGSTLRGMSRNKEDLQGTDMCDYMDEFTERQIQMLARHMLGSAEIAGVRIGEEIHRSLYLPPEEAEGGFWGKLLGGR